MDDLLAEFVAEAREMLDALSGEIVAWENDPEDKERLDSIFRFVHTVKGSCGFFDFPRLESLSHAAEDALADVRAGRRQADPALVTAILAIIDRITLLVDAIDSGAEQPEDDDAKLIAALEESGDVTGSGASAVKVSKTTSAPSTASMGPQRTIRLPIDLLDRVMSGVSDMTVARNDLARRLQTLDIGNQLDAPFGRLSAILGDLHEAITRIRMQRIESLFSAFPRLVRDLAQDLGKQVMVEIESGDVELDRELVEVIRDPLVHIIRNAVDHGIEAPADRLAAGKREIGLLQISARQTGSEIRIGIIDDGKGIDSVALVEKAIAAGVVTAEEAAKLSPRERNALICEAGLSTARQVTAVSGRGVGMDVVRANIEKIGGNLVIDSTPGSGTRIMIDVPLTLSIVPSITVGVARQTFAIPRSYVEEIVRVAGDQIETNQIGGRQFITLRGQRLACVGLDEVLQIENGEATGAARLFIIVKLVGGDVFGLAVDQILDHEELVVKPIAPALQKTGFYVGTTQLDDGKPVLMLDVAGVARESGMIRDVKDRTLRRDETRKTVREEISTKVLLFTAFDGARRAIPMDALNRIEKAKAADIRVDGEEAHVTIGDRILPLLGLEDEPLDGSQTNILRLEQDGGELAYAFAEIIDIGELSAAEAGAKKSDSEVGLVLVDGRQTELVDPARLFAGGTRKPRKQPRKAAETAGAEG